MATRTPDARRSGFTITELLVVIGLIIVLIGILLPALNAVHKSGRMTTSMSRLRQIGNFNGLYATDNREHIIPSQFDFSDDAVFTYPGKVRSALGPMGEGSANQGTWTDIVWTVFELADNVPSPDGDDYRFDSPDKALYDKLGGWDDNILRSSSGNTKNTPPFNAMDLPTPYGLGAQEQGYAGFFAANDFFNARPDAPAYVDGSGNSIPTPLIGRWYVMGQIKSPERSMYLVDSFAGEIITPVASSYDFDIAAYAPNNPPGLVDFRYNEACLMLFLDGHVDVEGRWRNLADLENSRGIRVSDPTLR